MNKFYLRRNARICATQMCIQKECTGNMGLNDFLNYPDLWAWGQFNIDLFCELCKDLNEHWDKITDILVCKSSKDIRYFCPILKGIIRCGLLETEIYKSDKKIIIPEYIRIGKSFLGNENIKSLYIYLN